MSYLYGPPVPTAASPAPSTGGVAAHARTPLRFPRCPFASRLVPRCTLAALAAEGGDIPATLTVGPPHGDPTLLPWRGGANEAGAPYRVRAPPTRVSEPTLCAAAAKAAAWTRVASVVRCALVRGGRGHEEKSPLDATTSLDWPWLASFTDAARLPPALGVDLIAGGARGAVLRAAVGEGDTLVVATAGTHRLLLTPPAAFLAAAYPFPTAHAADGAYMVDWGAPDEKAWPEFRQLRCWHATLTPGDALYVPALWASHWELPPDGPVPAVALAITFGRRDVADEGARSLAAARAAETTLSSTLPPAGVRAVLTSIGHGGEVRAWLAAVGAGGGWECVKTIATADALDSAAAALSACGREAIHDLTTALTSRRLRPTPWLETAGVDDFAAADTPTLCVDDRTEEERRYPALFRRSVEAKLAARRPWCGGRAVVGGGEGRLLQQ